MKIATQISLLIVGAVLVGVLSMGAFFAFNLERGFVGYINALQLRHFEALAQAVGRLAQRPGGLEALMRDRRFWNRLVRETEDGNVPGDVAEWRLPLEPQQRPGPPEFAGRPPQPYAGGEFEDRPRPPRPGPAEPDGRPRPPGAFGPEGEERPSPKGRPFPPPPPPGDAMGVGRRFILLDAQRRPLALEPLPPPGRVPPIEREIAVEGRAVAYIRHYPFERASRIEDLAFLRKQFVEAALVGLVVMLAGLLAAPWIARRWTRPMREIGDATRRIAQGAFDVRTHPGGADEIAELSRSVNAMAQSLSGLEAARKRWIAETAHELRTPLMTLRGEIEALQDGVRPFDARALQSLSEDVRQLTKLVSDLHLLAVSDMNGMPMTLARFDIAAMVRRVASRFRPRVTERGLALEVDAPAQPVAIDADEDRLEQLLANLLENSLRYTDAPGRVRVRLAREGAGVVLVVEDSAPGVPPQDHARLFDPLYRADPSRSRREGGSGLGLAIVQAIARAHGGTVAAAPSALGGLEIRVTLPP